METKEKLSLYESAHLFVAAVRLLTHKDQSPPDIDQVCDMLSLSQERGALSSVGLKISARWKLSKGSMDCVCLYVTI